MLLAMRTPIRSVLLAAAATLAAVGCGTSAPQPPAPQPANAPPPSAPAAPPNAAAPQQPNQVSLVWGSGWTVTVRPVFSGTAIPEGDGTITVTTWNKAPVDIAYTLPAFTAHSARPDIVAASEGVLRREPAKGTISVKPDAAAAGVFTPPVFWPGGAAVSPGPLLWFPSSVTDALKRSSPATIRIAPLPNGMKMKTESGEGPADQPLTLQGKGEVVLQIDGQPTRFPAYKLQDAEGDTFTLLDSPDNPLVVRFRFGSAPVVDGKKLVMAAQSGYDVVSMTRAR
jgi:hypothetical protein